MSSSWRCERNKTINAEINFRGMSRSVVPVMVQAERGVPSTQVWPLMKNYSQQEAMENFVFPDAIKTKLMKMSKLINIFMSHKIMRNRSKAVLLFTDICFFAQLSLQLFGVKTWNCKVVRSVIFNSG